MTVKVKSVEQILGDILRGILTESELNDVAAGSSLASLAEGIASSQFAISMQALKISESTQLESLVGVRLDQKAESMGLPNGVGGVGRRPAGQSSGVAKIGSGFNKISSKLYSGKAAPYAGSTVLFIENASEFPDSGVLYLGRGTVDRFEGPIAYSSRIDNRSYWTLELAVPLTKSHALTDLVVLSQGGNRVIQAGTTVSTQGDDDIPPVQFLTSTIVTIPDGEDTTTVSVICNQFGEVGNAAANSINSFLSSPFSGATVTNPTSLSNGQSAESDESLRKRIKEYPATLSRGVATAILSAVLGARDPATGKAIASAILKEASSRGDSSKLYIDDGSGLEPSYLSQAYELLLQRTSGQERSFRLAQYPVTPSTVIGSNLTPFAINATMELSVSVDGITETLKITPSNYKNINSVTALELARDFNSQSNLLAFRTMDNGRRLVLSDLSGNAEIIQVRSSELQRIIGLTLSEIRPLYLYKNYALQSFRGTTATLVTSPYPWDLQESDLIDIEVIVDSVTQKVTISNADFSTLGVNLATATLPDWIAVLKTKIAGVKFETLGNRLIWSTFNIFSQDGKLEILQYRSSDNSEAGWIGENKMWQSLEQGGTLRAIGSQKDYDLNRFSGEIKFVDKPVKGSVIETGTRRTRGQLSSKITPTGKFQLSPIPSTVGTSKLIMSFDGYSESLKLFVRSASTLTPTSLSSNVITLTSNEPDMFVNAKIGDYLFLAKGLDISSHWNDYVEGLYRILDSGDNWANIEVGIWENIDWTPLFGTPQVVKTDTLYLLRSEAIPQVVDFGNSALEDVDTIVSIINNQISSGSAIKDTPQQLSLRTNDFNNGSVSILAVIGNAVNLFDISLSESVQSHTANSPSYTTQASVPVFSIISDDYIHVDTNITHAFNGEISTISDTYPVGNEHLWATGKFAGIYSRVYNTSPVNPFDGILSTYGRVKLFGDNSSLNQLTYSNIGIRLQDLPLAYADKLVIEMDRNFADKTITVQMGKRAIIQDINTLTGDGAGQSINLRLADPDDLMNGSPRPFFDYTSPFNTFNLQDFKICTRSVGVYREAQQIPSPATGFISIFPELEHGDSVSMSNGTESVTFKFSDDGTDFSPDITAHFESGSSEVGSINVIDLVSDGDTVTISDGTNPAKVFEFYNSINGIPSTGNVGIPWNPGIAAIGYLTPISEILDGDTFTLTDHAGQSKTFEFDSNSSVSAGNIAIEFIVGASSNYFLNVITSIINNSGLSMIASIEGSDIKLEQSSVGTSGNTNISENINSPFTLSPVDFTGGTNNPSNADIAVLLRNAINAATPFTIDAFIDIPNTSLIRLMNMTVGIYSYPITAPVSKFEITQFSGGVNRDSDQSIRSNLIELINDNLLNITATESGTVGIALRNTNNGLVGNVPIVENTSNGSFSPIGMSGGIDSVLTDRALVLRSHEFNAPAKFEFSIRLPSEPNSSEVSVVHRSKVLTNKASVIVTATLPSGAMIPNSLLSSGTYTVVSSTFGNVYKLSFSSPLLNLNNEYQVGNILKVGGINAISGAYSIVSASPTIVEVIAAGSANTPVTQLLSAVTFPLSSYPIADTTLKDIADAINGYLQDSPVLSAESIGIGHDTELVKFPTFAIYSATPSLAGSIAEANDSSNFKMQDAGSAIIYEYDNSDPLSNGIKCLVQHIDSIFPNVADIGSTTYSPIGEEVFIVPTNTQTLVRWLNHPAISSIPALANIEAIQDGTRISISSKEDGSKGAVTITGVSANDVDDSIIGNATVDGDYMRVKMTTANAKPLLVNSFVKIENSISSEILRAYRQRPEGDQITEHNTVNISTYFRNTTSVRYMRLTANTARIFFNRYGMHPLQSEPLVAGDLVTFTPYAGGVVIVSSTGQLAARVGDMVYFTRGDWDGHCYPIPVTGFTDPQSPEYLGYPVIHVSDSNEIAILAPNITTHNTYTVNNPTDLVFMPAIFNEKNIRTNTYEGTEFLEAIGNECRFVVQPLPSGLAAIWLLNESTEDTSSMLLSDLQVASDDWAVLNEAFDIANRGTFKIVAHNGRNLLIIANKDSVSESLDGDVTDSKWGIVATASRPIRVISGDSVRISDKLRISASVVPNSQWFPNSLIGAFTVSGIGLAGLDWSASTPSVDPTQICPFVDIIIPNAPAYIPEINTGNPIDMFLLGDNNVSIGFIEGESYYTYRAVMGQGTDPSDTNNSYLYLFPSLRFGKVASTFGSRIFDIGKIGFSKESMIGIDGYKVHGGLVQQAHRITDGFSGDPIKYPGVKAAGTRIEVETPLIKSVSIEARVRPLDGVTMNAIAGTVRSAIAQYINRLGVGRPVILSEVVRIIQELPGVFSVTIMSTKPEAEDDRIAVSDTEKALILDIIDDIIIG